MEPKHEVSKEHELIMFFFRRVHFSLKNIFQHYVACSRLNFLSFKFLINICPCLAILKMQLRDWAK